ncbi:MAG TPA: DUF2589 domain-containing protein [Longimicrobiaceae bacterium]|nr:DUF2589 domain-containing protein [Longimicrobiaceae bacterium]
MPLDTSGASTALNLLNGIDYGAVIGAPLQAAITAQAMAARSTWEFIQQVGLKTDDRGNKEAVNVSFTYMSGGNMVRLIVPILTIVPIPAIEVTDINIAFKANINASASNTTEETASQQMGGELGVTAQAGWGPFSVSANFKANYSSKKDSKATADSRYSVEYTQDISVKAGQAGLPAGLATILNILSNAATGTPANGKLSASPAVGTLDATTPDDPQILQLRVVNGSGLNVVGAVVTAAINPVSAAEAVQVGPAPFGTPYTWASGSVQATTGSDGIVGLNVSLVPAKLNKLPDNNIFELRFGVSLDGKQQQVTVPFRVTGVSRPTLQPSTAALDLRIGDNTGQMVTVTATDALGSPVAGANLTITKTGDNAAKLDAPASATTVANGTASVRLKWADGAAAGKTAEVKFATTLSGKAVEAKVTVTAVAAAAPTPPAPLLQAPAFEPSLEVSLAEAQPEPEPVRRSEPEPEPRRMEPEP